MSEHVEVPVPEEAYEAGVQVASEELGFRAQVIVRQRIERVVNAAAPFIAAKAVEGVGESVRLAEEKGRREGRQQERERLTSQAALDAGCKALEAAGAEYGRVWGSDVGDAFRAAFAALDQEGDGDGG